MRAERQYIISVAFHRGGGGFYSLSTANPYSLDSEGKATVLPAAEVEKVINKHFPGGYKHGFAVHCTALKVYDPDYKAFRADFSDVPGAPADPVIFEATDTAAAADEAAFLRWYHRLPESAQVKTQPITYMEFHEARECGINVLTHSGHLEIEFINEEVL